MSTRVRSRDPQEVSMSVSQLEADLLGLESLQSRLESEGDYSQAERIRTTAADIRCRLTKERVELLAANQQKLMEELNAAQLADFDSFNQTWDVKLRTKADVSEETVNTQKESNEQAASDLQAKLEAEPVKPWKQSAALIQLREREKHAAKSKNYLEAQFCKDRARELEAAEAKKAADVRADQINKKVGQLRKKLNLELSNLKQRLARELHELITIRGMETEELLRKYQNSRKELETAQRIAKNKYEGRNTTVGGRSIDSEKKVARIFNQSRLNISRDEVKTPVSKKAE